MTEANDNGHSPDLSPCYCLLWPVSSWEEHDDDDDLLLDPVEMTIWEEGIPHSVPILPSLALERRRRTPPIPIPIPPASLLVVLREEEKSHSPSLYPWWPRAPSEPSPPFIVYDGVSRWLLRGKEEAEGEGGYLWVTIPTYVIQWQPNGLWREKKAVYVCVVLSNREEKPMTPVPAGQWQWLSLFKLREKWKRTQHVLAQPSPMKTSYIINENSISQ